MATMDFVIQLLIALQFLCSTTLSNNNGTTVNDDLDAYICCGNNGGYGDIGAPGFPGPPGDSLKGATGIEGRQGDPGKIGEQGDMGIVGFAGSFGPMGLPGPTGPSGAPGLPAAPGSPGRKGEKGVAGPDGMMGRMGPYGQTGDYGPPGVRGLPGVIGWVGAKGAMGYPGKSGKSGSYGRDGTEGYSGWPGMKGDKGSLGRQGDLGPRGFPGRKGISPGKGTKGLRGLRGYQGDRGTPSYVRCIATSVNLLSNMSIIHDTTQPGFDQPVTIIFDNVITNVGGAYDQASGWFTAPGRGLYRLGAVLAARGSLGTHGAFVIRRFLANSSLPNSAHYRRGSRIAGNAFSTVQMLEAGDSVAIQIMDDDCYYDDALKKPRQFINKRRRRQVRAGNTVSTTTILGDTFTSFTAYLVHPFDSSLAINYVAKI